MEFIIMSPDHDNPREAYSFDLTYPEDPRNGAVVFSGTKVCDDFSIFFVARASGTFK